MMYQSGGWGDLQDIANIFIKLWSSVIQSNRWMGVRCYACMRSMCSLSSPCIDIFMQEYWVGAYISNWLSLIVGISVILFIFFSTQAFLLFVFLTLLASLWSVFPFGTLYSTVAMIINFAELVEMWPYVCLRMLCFNSLLTEIITQ